MFPDPVGSVFNCGGGYLDHANLSPICLLSGQKSVSGSNHIDCLSVVNVGCESVVRSLRL